MKVSFSKQKANRTQALMGKSNRPPKIAPLPKTQNKDGKQDNSTDADLEKCPRFTDIWPSELFAPSDLPIFDKNWSQSSISNSSEVDTEHSSVLASFVDRFRHGQPQSREERQQKCSNSEKQLPIWWASCPSSSNLTPEKTDQRLSCHNRAISPCRGSPSVLLDSSQIEPYDSDILLLEKGVSRLLEKRESYLEEDRPPVSSDGIGCSDFSSPVSADEPVRNPMISILPKYNAAKHLPSVMQSSVAPVHEEDILTKWRVGRRAEMIKFLPSQQQFDIQDMQGYSKSQSLHSECQNMGQQTIYAPDLPQGATHLSLNEAHFTTLDKQTRVTTTATTMPMRPSESVVSSPQALANVPSHVHLLCDILPCPNQTPYSQEKERFSQKPDSQMIVLPQKTQSLPSESPINGHTITKVPKKKRLEKDEKKLSLFSMEKKKSTRVQSEQKMSTNISTSSPQRQHKFTESKKKSRGDVAPLCPIKSALGQVVSEVLFSSMGSTTEDVQDICPPSPPCLVSEPENSNCYESVEIISQPLQEVEDENEFEDDHLLQVLRKKRKWIKEQINDVETSLKKFQEQNVNT